VFLLTKDTKAKERELIFQELEKAKDVGKGVIVIGTHALLSRKSLEMIPSLDFCVVDEEQR